MARDRRARPEARPLRLFVAADVPETIRKRLAAAIDPWRDALPTARWVAPENWHLTLKFLGSVYPRLRDWVGERVAEAAGLSESFETRLIELGAFPSARRARVLWAGLADPLGRFGRLAADLDRLLEPEFAPEKRAFTPHLTVARFREQVGMEEGVLSLEVESAPFRVEALTLYRSYLQRPAARYEPLARYPLGRA